MADDSRKAKELKGKLKGIGAEDIWEQLIPSIFVSECVSIPPKPQLAEACRPSWA
jgi:hypothetical protein